uniref:Fanconi anemia group M protein n=1 Tax=Strigamia maritima TaxID=126957 RepID=T1ISI1_STRMM
MNRQKKQKTLLQTWSSTPSTSRKTTGPSLEEIDLTDEPTEEDLLLSAALDLSLAEYNAAQTSTSTAIRSSTTVESLPGFDNEAGKTWIYPTNYPIRDYQYSMVEQALYKNTMIILPTGLGKTFIAAVVMYNYFRWYPRGKIIFMAPTKPLVAQQIEACFDIMGIPLADSAEMTGAMSPENRQKTWQDKRVFFITPQVMNNDLARGICPAADVKLLVFDEAHKATKNYAYCQVLNEVVRYSLQFRVLALSATPGSDLITVRQVFQNLLIADVACHTEDSLAIQPYTFIRKVETIVVPMNEELKRRIDGILSVLTVYIERLKKHKLIFCNNVASMKQYNLVISREQFQKRSKLNMNKGLANVIELTYTMAIIICHAYEMLIVYGLRTFYSCIKEHFDSVKGNSLSRRELLSNVTLNDIMDELRPIFDSENFELEDGFISHPKLTIVEQLVRDHLTNFDTKIGEASEQSSTRVMIFSAYRSSVDEITNILNRNRPLIRAMAFTGQATSGSSKGITQKEQIEIIKQFRRGGYNTLVATSVGEEGLDIGAVDLIICFDVHKSPIRSIQRMGRTGRKREGRVVMLTTEGRDEWAYEQSKSKAANIIKSISKENFERYAGNPRMVPKGINPRCHKMHITVPVYQRTVGRKKKNPVEASTNNILKFLKRHVGNKNAQENDKDDSGEISNEVEKTKCGTVRKRSEKKTDVNPKPCRLNKKQKKALILDDSDDAEEMMNAVENRKESEPETMNEIEPEIMNEIEPENMKESESENIGSENDFEMNDVEHFFTQDYDVPIDASKNDVYDDDFFPDMAVNLNRKVCGLKSAVRSPPKFTCVFNKRKEELSPIDYEQILKSGQNDETVILPVVQNKHILPVESKGFGVSEMEINDSYYLSPVKSSMDFDEPVSPIITSCINKSRMNYEIDDVNSFLSKSIGKKDTFSVTQLINMVHQDSMRIHPEENFTKLNDKTPKKKEDEKKVVPNFDLKCDFSFGDDSEDDVIPSSQNENKIFTTKDGILPVTFDMNVQEFFQDSVDEIDSSIGDIKHVTSTPKVQKVKKPQENTDSSFDWEHLPRVKCVKFAKKKCKKSTSKYFVESQAAVSNVISSDEDSESDLDIIESSFIDDNTQAVEKSMTAVYLKSVKDNVGPKQFKINPSKDINMVDMIQMTQDEYQEDSFCVANDNVELEEMQGNEKNAKKWKRIVNKCNSALEANETVIEPPHPGKDKRIVNKSDSTLEADETVIEPPAKDNSNDKDEDNLLVLIDSRGINGCHQLISELRHQYKVQTHVVSLNSCDYIVSTRMGVERILFSSVSNIASKNRVVEKISSMSYLFDRSCLIIEADREKLGLKKNGCLQYYNRLISALLQLPIKVLHSDSQKNTASLLRELALDEKKKGFGLSIDCTVPLSKKNEQLLRLYQKIPVVNYLVALNLCNNMLSVQQLVN